MGSKQEQLNNPWKKLQYGNAMSYADKCTRAQLEEHGAVNISGFANPTATIAIIGVVATTAVIIAFGTFTIIAEVSPLDREFNRRTELVGLRKEIDANAKGWDQSVDKDFSEADEWAELLQFTD